MKPAYKTALIWIGLVLLIILAWRFFALRPDVEEVGLHQLRADVREDRVKDVRIHLKKQQYTYAVEQGDGEPRLHRAVGPVDEGMREELDAAGVRVTYEGAGEAPFWTGLLLTWLPILVLVGLFIFFMRQMQAGSGRAMNFGKSRARMISSRTNKTSFRDVEGIDEVLEELEEVIAFLKDPKRFQNLGGKIPKGVLLMGSPGTGKTLLARAIAGEAGVPFFTISGSDFVEMFVGVGASRVRDLFEQAKKNAPCIVFIDEIDAVGRQRGAGIGGGHDEREQTLNQLLVEMDGFEANEGVMIIAATNRPDVLDPAILRPGRFDRRVVVPRPDIKGRYRILKLHAANTPLGEDVDLEQIARGTPGFSGADLENLVNEAALLAARFKKKIVELMDFEMAKDKVLMGSERRSMVISEKERITTAYHESGHALAAHLLEHADPVHKVTIIPRGQAMGVTQQLPVEDRYFLSREFARDKIVVEMAGRAAEEICLDQQTTGAAQDLEQATDLARKMVMQWGMSDKLGPLAYSPRDEAIFIGREIAQHQEYSEKTAVLIDEEVRGLVVEAQDRARALIREHREALERLVGALMAHESLDAAQITAALEGRPVVVRPIASEHEAHGDLGDADNAPSGAPLLNPEPEKA